MSKLRYVNIVPKQIEYNEPINLNRTFKFLIPELKNLLEFTNKKTKKNVLTMSTVYINPN